MDSEVVVRMCVSHLRALVRQRCCGCDSRVTRRFAHRCVQYEFHTIQDEVKKIAQEVAFRVMMVLVCTPPRR